MALFKCKMCGGSLEIASGTTVIECEYCGTQQTLPKLDDDKRANLYDRANHFRRNNEFDKAMGIYEQILNEDGSDAEAYWSLVLCRYGVEYVKDPNTHKHIPTVNRTQYTSIFDDEDYKSALKNSDMYQRTVYETEAKAINEIQKEILSISQKEEPFDVFICYKESDNNGRRTQDSVLAQDLYYQLTQEGFKVFFARITLEDKLGSAYEPYIFAALNTAKIMVVLGTKPEYFNAVWVKNEWSRYLALVKKDHNKMLIPAYRDMDPYDLPEEFSHLQAQDMSKLGFMQDLIRGIKKIATKDEPKTTVIKETVVTNAGASANAAPLLKRAFIFLEDGDWNSANEYCEKVLDIDPENAEAYLGKLMAELHVKKQESLKNYAEPLDNSSSYAKILRYGDDALKTTLISYNDAIKLRKAEEDARIAEEERKTEEALETADFVFRKRPDKNEVNEVYINRVTIKKNNVIIPKYDTLGNLVSEIGSMAFYDKESLKKITIPDSITSIGESAFYKCKNLTSVTIGNGVTSIGKSAFDCCHNLTSITIPASVTSIGERAFYCCHKLTRLNIGNGVTSIGESAFAGCHNLTSITIPASVTSIGKSAFNCCKECTSITVDGNNLVYRGESNCIIEKNTNKLILGCKTSTIPDGVTSIGEEAFNCCHNLTNITIPDSVTSIGKNAFSACDNLTSVTIGNGVTSIGEEAFSACHNLTNITIPDSVTSIGKEAFNYCYNLETITFKGTKKEWNAITKGFDWDTKVPAKKVVCSDGTVRLRWF